MSQDEYIIKRLGAETLSAELQNDILEAVRVLIGEAISEGLSEQQVNEYEAIIDDHEIAIDLWLKQHVPNYKDSVVYQQFVEGYEEDPEHNRPEKLFANLAWVELNVPNVKGITNKVIDEFKAKHLTTS
jgi:hypothetical protein